jgi:hypothetical protein
MGLVNRRPPVFISDVTHRSLKIGCTPKEPTTNFNILYVGWAPLAPRGLLGPLLRQPLFETFVSSVCDTLQAVERRLEQHFCHPTGNVT